MPAWPQVILKIVAPRDRQHRRRQFEPCPMNQIAQGVRENRIEIFPLTVRDNRTKRDLRPTGHPTSRQIMGTYPDLSLPCAARVRWWACCFQWLGSRIFRSIGIPLLNSCQNAPNFPPGGFSSAPLCAIINDAGGFVLPVKSFWRCSLTSSIQASPGIRRNQSP
jgi:hypothetical protein